MNYSWIETKVDSVILGYILEWIHLFVDNTKWGFDYLWIHFVVDSIIWGFNLERIQPFLDSHLWIRKVGIREKWILSDSHQIDCFCTFETRSLHQNISKSVKPLGIEPIEEFQCS